MKLENRIKQILVELAANDKLPLDMNELDPSVFAEALTKENLITSLENEHEVLRVIWCNDDIRQQIENNGYPSYTEEQVQNIADAISNNWDAGIGVSWDTLDYYIQEEMGEAPDEDEG